MDIPRLAISRSNRRAVWSTLMLAAAATMAAEQPRPVRAPQPGTLAAYARRITLRQTETGRVVITNENLGEHAAAGTVTLGTVSMGGAAATKAPDAAERTRWRNAYQKQRQVITGLERRRALLEVEIDHIEDGALTAKNLARLDRAEAELRVLDEEIKQERAELSRIVREARRHGAEPGWFR